jgi:murein L,D-transpeptidase YcbB/YkuD
LLTGCGEGSPRAAAEAPPARAGRAEPVVLPATLAELYKSRGHKPLWVSGAGLSKDGQQVLRRLATAEVEGLDPARYGVAEIEKAAAAASSGDRTALARADLLLTRALDAYLRDLHGPVGDMLYVDDGIAPVPPDPPALLASEAGAQAVRLNPLYEALRRGAVAWRAANPAAPEREMALVRANLERARAIPAHDGRYLIVDAGSARLWMIDGRKVEGPMRVIVGKAGMQTPQMAGLIRYTTLNPYWNLPPDLARERAKRVLRQGTGFLAAERIDVLSDWGDNPRVMKLSAVDWRAAAAGKGPAAHAAAPGGGNVMGDMKFMFPNELGIYLHDYPDKSLFQRPDRALSSGCVRVADAQRLARWLYGGAAPRPQGSAPEQQVDLPAPVPVYITYLTALPGPGRLVFREDGYRRDRPVLARLAAASGIAPEAQ